jgi:hypothetical protein
MKIPIKVVVIAFLWLIIINPGSLNGDTLRRLRITHALWTETEEVPLDYQPSSKADPNAGILGVGGKHYYGDDLGQSLLMLPGDWLGTKLNQLLPQQESNFFRSLVVSFLIFVPLNLAAIISCFWLLRLFDFEEVVAGLASITLLLCTTVLHYSQVHQQNNQLLLCVTIGYATVLAYVRCRDPRFLIFSGLALSIAFLIRAISIIHIFTVLTFLFGCLLYQNRDKSNNLKAIASLKIGMLWILGFIPCFILGRFLNYIRYGSFLTTGQTLSVKEISSDPAFLGLANLPPNYPFINPPHVGILGVLFSPAKSIFIYDPLLLPCLILGIIFWKKFSPYLQCYLITCIFNLALHIFLTSRLDFWAGDSAWGARYHLTSVHLLLIPLIALSIQQIRALKNFKRSIAIGAIALAFLVQISSIIFRPPVEVKRFVFNQPEDYLEFRLAKRLNNITCLFDRSFSQKCYDKIYSNPKSPLINQVNFLPIKISRHRNLALIIWGLVLISIVLITFKFYLAY